MKNRIEKNKHLALKQKKIEIKEKREKRNKILGKIIIKLFIIVLLLFIYSRYVEPNILVVHEQIIKTEKISDFGITITHFSDLHYGMTINKNNIDHVIDKINATNSDIVVFTGDLVDSNHEITNEDMTILKDSLNKINASIGKYAVYGNHDYNSEKNYREILTESGFKLLVNEYEFIYNNDDEILIYGLDDVVLGNPDITKIESTYNEKMYNIVLMHETDYLDTFINNYKIDLVLAGHSHNGQINIPYFGPLYLPYDSKKYYEYYYNVNNTNIYVSNGIGTSLYKLRFFSIPSINVYRITKS